MFFAVVFTVVLLVHHVQADFSCRADLAMNDAQRKLFLDGHNDVRRNVALGRQENREGFGRVGPARNMYALNWDCDLERSAQDSVATCALNATHHRPDTGRNIIATSGPDTLSDDLYMQIALLNWVSPVKFFGKVDPTNEYEERLCAFANMVYSESTKVGCSFKRCGRDFFVTCLYDKCSNVENRVIFENGDACRADTDCTTFQGSRCDDGLCIKPGF